MGKYILSKWRRPDLARAFPGQARNVFPMMLVLFLTGALVGCIVGLYLPPGGVRADAGAYAAPETLPAALWNTGQFFVLLFFLSTSWLGLLLAPAAVLLRGYLLSCSVSALFASGSWKGLLSAALISGIPALFLVPCFLIAACDAFFSSRRLLALRFGQGDVSLRPGALLRVPVIVVLIFLNALYSAYLLPALLAK